MDFSEIKFDDRGLVPAIAQDINSKEVLMLAWMNRDSIVMTLKEMKACYWSRSRQELWVKGATSGHYQYVKKVKYDCDGDTILLEVEQVGGACHTGNRTCFYRELSG
jgi:phosphoribosyl-AMP cyclohydrolase